MCVLVRDESCVVPTTYRLTVNADVGLLKRCIRVIFLLCPVSLNIPAVRRVRSLCPGGLWSVSTCSPPGHASLLGFIPSVCTHAGCIKHGESKQGLDENDRGQM